LEYVHLLISQKDNYKNYRMFHNFIFLELTMAFIVLLKFYLSLLLLIIQFFDSYQFHLIPLFQEPRKFLKFSHNLQGNEKSFLIFSKIEEYQFLSLLACCQVQQVLTKAQSTIALMFIRIPNHLNPINCQNI
jgi:hypothetical protein